jgi:hypothetical protein
MSSVAPCGLGPGGHVAATGRSMSRAIGRLSLHVGLALVAIVAATGWSMSRAPLSSDAPYGLVCLGGCGHGPVDVFGPIVVGRS